MEQNFYHDEFESFLKESVDDFRMYPSRKVWHSLYNDLHPGRKWPSLAVSLVLISAILFLGISNNNAINNATRKTAAIPAINNNDDIPGFENNNPSRFLAGKESAKAQGSNNQPDQPSHTLPGNLNVVNTRDDAGTEQSQRTYATGARVIAMNNRTTGNRPHSRIQTGRTNTESLVSAPDMQVAPATATPGETGINTMADAGFAQATQAPADPVSLIPSLKLDGLKLTASAAGDKSGTTPVFNAEEQSWIEHYAMYNSRNKKAWKNRTSMEYYATPSIGYRKLDRTSEVSTASRSIIAQNNSEPANVNDQVTQSPSLNLEAGANFLYSIGRRLRLKSGVQVNYTNYTINANQLDHPSQTTLTMKNENGFPDFVYRNSYLGNNPGTAQNLRLNNNTVQLSIPFGADMKLLTIHNISWYAGATFQPSLILTGNAYALSSDTKNYVKEDALLRKWNMNAGMETFVSYKTPSGLIIQAGPQFRYQILSSYQDAYNYSEKLYNLGLKIGVVKGF